MSRSRLLPVATGVQDRQGGYLAGRLAAPSQCACCAAHGHAVRDTLTWVHMWAACSHASASVNGSGPSERSSRHLPGWQSCSSRAQRRHTEHHTAHRHTPLDKVPLRDSRANKIPDGALCQRPEQALTNERMLEQTASSRLWQLATLQAQHANNPGLKLATQAPHTARRHTDTYSPLFMTAAGSDSPPCRTLTMWRARKTRGDQANSTLQGAHAPHANSDRKQ